MKYVPTLARRYAAALAQLAQEQEVLDTLATELRALVKLANSSPEFATTFYSPCIPAKIKVQIINTTLSQQLSPLCLHFVLLLVSKRRERYLEDIAAAFVHYADVARHTIQADVRVAVPLSSTQEEALCRQLASFIGKQVRLETHIDPAILGGVIAQMEGIIIDGSVATRLRQLKDAIPEINVGSQE